MPMWRCPHCGTPQTETSRCWVCKRSSTSCGTCRHFRRAIAGQLGYCGLDPRRQPLRGDELRGCWEAGPSFEAPDEAPAREYIPLRSSLDFVPVEPTKAAHRGRAGTRAPAPAAPPVAAAPRDPGLGFWGEEG
jgi:hypothetical protein